jgi:hypothetical protein
MTKKILTRKAKGMKGKEGLYKKKAIRGND